MGGRQLPAACKSHIDRGKIDPWKQNLNLSVEQSLPSPLPSPPKLAKEAMAVVRCARQSSAKKRTDRWGCQSPLRCRHTVLVV